MSLMPQAEIGANAFSWAKYVTGSYELLDENLNRKFSRETLFAYCNNPTNQTEHAVIAILAWGGMNRDYGKRLFNEAQKVMWLPHIEKIRNKTCTTRKEAYKLLHELRLAGQLPGLGVAYFTKLICFLNQDLNGYIMDQWTSKSMNLLQGENYIAMLSGWVSDSNCACIYDIFCERIESLASELNCSGLDAEEKIFSQGRGKGKWRNYVKKIY